MAQGLSQKQVATLLGYTPKWMSDFERGRVDPPSSMVLALAAVLGVDLLGKETVTHTETRGPSRVRPLRVRPIRRSRTSG